MARTYQRTVSEDRLVMTTACQYCAVGCGYRAVLLPEGAEADGENRVEVFPSFISSAMRNRVRYRGRVYEAAVVPDARCDLNRGNHSVRGGSQGANLVTADGKDRSTMDRLVSPQVRCKDGELHPITWHAAIRVIAALIAASTDLRWRSGDNKPALIEASTPVGLGVKIYEYQYLENTFAATKLFYRALGLPNVAYHDRPSSAGSSPGVSDAGFRPHDFAYEDVRGADTILLVGSNPYENQSVFFMQNCTGKELIVLDPRRTASAQYAVDTGGLHLQPKFLGADSLVLYAMARELLEALPEDAIHSRVAQSLSTQDRAGFVGDGSPSKVRRASRALGLAEFKEWLGVGDRTSSTYTLENAARVSGIPLEDLKEAVRRLSSPAEGGSELPVVALLYEKGLIWGFNYHNTAAVASLGLVLWRPNQLAPLTGRCGGHQKGWARADRKVKGFFARDDKGYPFHNCTDLYNDDRLRELAADPDIPWQGDGIKVHHNLDTHVFGPDPLMKRKEDAPGNGEPKDDHRILLKNYVETVAKPDVRLLWIIGGNYLGQTHNAEWKQQKLDERRRGVETEIQLPDIEDLTREDEIVEEILRVLMPRVRDAPDGLVVVQQEIFPNATTEVADLVLPASGWGEDDFVRYNAERRLRLYERFQDPPVEQSDSKRLRGRDPLAFRDDHKVIQHSPKADWAIFRDVAKALIDLMGDKEGANEASLANAYGEFAWKSSSEVADEMAEASNRSSILGALLPFAAGHGVPRGIRIHKALGLGGEGDSELLAKAYSVPEGSTVLGNGVASNGVLLPAKLGPMDEAGLPTLQGSLRRVPNADVRFNFVRADWDEISDWFEKLAPKDGEVALTCGRVNHLWNNLFHHVRNDYVAERYPEDLPGTVLEVNPEWAERRSLDNGTIVEVKNERGSFRAVISKQDSLATGTAFAIFSYPVWDAAKKGFSFRGFANNLMNGYWDGINPIGALKYGRAEVLAVPGAEGGGIYQAQKRRGPSYGSARRGPSYAQRNRIVSLPLTEELRPGVDDRGRWSRPRRLDWRMRELIVAKGLPRAYVHSGQERQASLLDPDTALRDLRRHLGSVFPMMLAAMKWPVPGLEDAGKFDVWDGIDLAFARDEWGRSVELECETDVAETSQIDADVLERFVAWSEELTGFDDLRNDLPHARSILKRLLGRDPDVSERLNELLAKLDVRFGRLTHVSLRGAYSDRELTELTTVLWYTGAFMNDFGFPETESPESPVGFGALSDDHYRKGLLWRAARLQPQGYSTRLELWAQKPEEDDES